MSESRQFLNGDGAAVIALGLTYWQGSFEHAICVLNRFARLQGPLPAWPSSGRAMPALQFLMLDSNWNLTGQLSAQWGSPLSMSRLSVLSARDCDLGGTLPPSWPTQLPQLQVIDLTNNLVMGEKQKLPSASRLEGSRDAHKQELMPTQGSAGRVASFPIGPYVMPHMHAPMQDPCQTLGAPLIPSRHSA